MSYLLIKTPEFERKDMIAVEDRCGVHLDEMNEMIEKIKPMVRSFTKKLNSLVDNLFNDVSLDLEQRVVRKTCQIQQSEQEGGSMRSND